MAAEVSLKEESALEIGKQLAFSFQGLQAVGADTANNALELEEEREQTSYLEKIRRLNENIELKQYNYTNSIAS